MTADDAPREFAPNHDEALAVIARARHYNDWLFSRAGPYLGRRMLDAGAGTGTFVALGRGAGVDVVALEPHPPFAAHLRERFADDDGVEVAEAELESVNRLGLADFDSIVCFNVLEHVPDDEAALGSLRELLAPGGRLLLLVPAHPALYGATDRAIGHERRYRRRDLGMLLERSGYELETLRYVNPAGAVGWFLNVRLRRRRIWPVGSFKTFDRLVPALRHLDRLPLPFGLSVWAVARRPR